MFVAICEMWLKSKMSDKFPTLPLNKEKTPTMSNDIRIKRVRDIVKVMMQYLQMM